VEGLREPNKTDRSRPPLSSPPSGLRAAARDVVPRNTRARGWDDGNETRVGIVMGFGGTKSVRDGTRAREGALRLLGVRGTHELQTLTKTYFI
jgi:hypothetical protein